MKMVDAIPYRSSYYSNIPGDGGLPVLGGSLDLFQHPLDVMDKKYQRYGEIFWSKIFGIRLITMVGPDANQFVLLDKDKAFSNNLAWDFFIGPFFHRGIMLLDFEEHRHHRKIMQAVFKKPVLVEYLNEMNPAIDQGIFKWSRKRGYLALDAIKQLTLDLATHVFMGDQLGREANKLNRAFVDTVRAGTSIIRYPVPGGRWKKGLDGRKTLERYFHSKIAAKRNSNTNDLFSQLCRAKDEEGKTFSDADVVNHMIFLMMAAHDTTTITLTQMMYHLAKNPEWQERLRDESFALGKSALDHEDLEKMTGMTLVMKESLRLCSPVPVIPRKTVKDVQFKNFTIPKGTMVSLSPYYTHYMEEYWPDRMKFDPMRFSEERREDAQHPFCWVPFGGGAHKCIGLQFADLQVKAILHKILLRYRWFVPTQYEMPMDFTSLPVPKDGLPLKIRRL